MHRALVLRGRSSLRFAQELTKQKDRHFLDDTHLAIQFTMVHQGDRDTR